jgi:LysM repeat protein
MTILGIDISHWSDLAHKPVDITDQGYDFLFWKSTEGSTYVDSTFPGTCPKAYGNPLFAAFHYMDDSTILGQLNNIRKVVPFACPVIVDMEQGSITTAQNLLRALQGAGYSTPLFYLPEWYWHRISNPDLSHFPPLWTSVRVPGTGYGSELYGKVSVQNWHSYGNAPSTAMVQFTQEATVDGVHGPVDVSAYAGTRDELNALLHNTKSVTPAPPQILTYTVRAGDTLWGIAFATLGNGAQWQLIASANGLSNPNRLVPGQVLRIPGWDGIVHSTSQALNYTVAPGDNLTAISKRFGISVEVLYAANRGAIGPNPNHISPGMVLSIPRVR